MSDLRVFFNGGAYVIADSPENASKLLSIHFGPSDIIQKHLADHFERDDE